MPETDADINGARISRLQEDHIDEILQIMNKEGWCYYDHHELQRYLELNQDCFTLLREEHVIGSIFTTCFGNQAWIGNVIVSEENRGTGLASELIKKVMRHLSEDKQIRTFRLGSVPLAIGLYSKAGFHAETFTTAQQAALPIKLKYEQIDLGKNIHVQKLNIDDLKTAARIDELFFKSNRLPLLLSIYNSSIKECCFCLKAQQNIVGYLMARRRKTSKKEGCLTEGPDYVYRLGPSCVLPEYGINGFKALFQEAILHVNDHARIQGGTARIYVVFPRNANKEEILKDTEELAHATGMDATLDLSRIFNEHDHIFQAPNSTKNEEQWEYMKRLGFCQEYFEQVMSYTTSDAKDTKADTEGIFASATPGDKA